MLDAKVFVFIEPILGTDNRLRYITDISDDRVICTQDEFFTILKQHYKFKVDQMVDFKTKLNSGMSLIIDLEKKVDYRYDDRDKFLIRKKIIRDERPKSPEDFEIINKKVENIVKRNFFKE